MNCPQCKSDSARRSHRVDLWERLVSLAGYHPFRCPSCKRRFLSLPDQPPQPVATRSIAREISATRRALRWKRQRRDFLLYGTAVLVFAVVLYFLTREPSTSD